MASSRVVIPKNVLPTAGKTGSNANAVSFDPAALKEAPLKLQAKENIEQLNAVITVLKKAKTALDKRNDAAYFAARKGFDSSVSAAWKNGEWVDKRALSTFFPKNWPLGRVQEEILYVYENTVGKGVGLKKTIGDKMIYEGLSTNQINIRIEIMNDEIINSYPITN